MAGVNRLLYSTDNGPVIQSVQVVPIYYGSHPFQQALNLFYADVVASTYFDVLQQYDTPTQQIRRGSLGTPITHSSPRYTSNLNIAQYLQSLATARVITPNENTYYPVHLGPEIDHVTGGCALHGSTFDLNSNNRIIYAVLPFTSTSSCRGNSVLASIQQSSSHELMEAVTNGAVDRMAWNNHGLEISDMCNGRIDSLILNGRNHTIHQIWSNCDGKCVSKSTCATAAQ
ncbi:hypothetical protein BDR26DRAFT_862849 [Obelidium mucronatum]|nr:hypothetical protein BDR26DRAFT_862849 [Obelidium mucronatum]